MGREELLMQQYHELGEQYRLYNRHFWQIPTLLIAITTGVIGSAYFAVQDQLARTLLLAIGTSFSFVIIIVLYKIQLFQYNVDESLKIIEEELKIHRLPWHGGVCIKKPSNWFERRGAYASLIIYSYFLFIILFMLTLYNFILFLQGVIPF